MEPGCGRGQEWLALASVWSGYMAVKAMRLWSSRATWRNSAPIPFHTVAAVAGDAVRGPLDVHQALDIEVQQIAGRGVFVTIRRRLGLDAIPLVEPEPREHAADDGRTQPGGLRDAQPGPALTAQHLDPPDEFTWALPRQPVRPRTAIGEPRNPQFAIALDPFACALAADLELGRPSTTDLASSSRVNNIVRASR